jgi:hypothetical protein
MPRKPKPASKPETKPVAPRLLSGGNPQIAKAEGDAPVQAYIAALPGWKSAVATRIDALIVREVPGVAKAVKYNSPLYGVPGRGWFLGLHAFIRRTCPRADGASAVHGRVDRRLFRGRAKVPAEGFARRACLVG